MTHSQARDEGQQAGSRTRGARARLCMGMVAAVAAQLVAVMAVCPASQGVSSDGIVQDWPAPAGPLARPEVDVLAPTPIETPEPPAEAGIEPAAGSEASGFAPASLTAGPASLAVAPRPRRQRRIPPATPEQADDPLVAAAMRAAPQLPGLAPRYRGQSQTMEAAREIRRRVPRFVNFRGAIPYGTWSVEASHLWRVRDGDECLAALRQAGVRVRPFEPEPEPDAEEAIDPFPTPNPVQLRAQVGGVRFIAARAPGIMSCELAARLPALARVAAAHGVTRVVMSSLWRPSPVTSFHTMGLGMDIRRMEVTEPLTGPDGGASRWLRVETDFLETPDHPTCDAELLGPDSPLGGNERGRRLLAIACALHDTGEFASVLTPNYNSGHRDHFHIDIRPDDPRTFIR